MFSKHMQVDSSGVRAGKVTGWQGWACGGASTQGTEGLRNYLWAHHAQFYLQFSRKLLGYALGREVPPSTGACLARCGRR